MYSRKIDVVAPNGYTIGKISPEDFAAARRDRPYVYTAPDCRIAGFDEIGADELCGRDHEDYAENLYLPDDYEANADGAGGTRLRARLINWRRRQALNEARAATGEAFAAKLATLRENAAADARHRRVLERRIEALEALVAANLKRN